VTLTASPDTKCKACGKHFTRSNSFRTVCSGSCVDFFAAKVEREAKRRAKEAKKLEAEKTRARRVALKSRRDWLEEAQKAVNAYVRARDRGLSCISCEKPWEDTFQAGHYLSRGARPELRFDLDNIHGQCVRCNMHLSGNLIGYRAGLAERRSDAVIAKLEGPHPPAKWSIDELKTMRDAFRILTKQELEKQ
jgi:hypothetical protein